MAQCVDFHTHDKSKTYERVISEQKRRDHINEPSQVFAVVVPHVIPSFLQYCDIIDVSYKLEVFGRLPLTLFFLLSLFPTDGLFFV